MSTPTPTSPRTVVELDGAEVAITSTSIDIHDIGREVGIVMDAHEAVQLYDALDKHINALRETAHASAIAHLWTQASAAAAVIARLGVDIYSVRVDWNRDYTARQAEILLGSVEELGRATEGSPVVVVPTASGLYEYHQVELRPGVVAQAQVRRQAAADAGAQAEAVA